MTDIQAYDLGEDGDTWMVEGTLDTQVAEDKVHDLWKEQQVYEDNQEWLGEHTMKFTARSDWYWEPVNEKYPDDETQLRNVAKHGNKNMFDTFKGVLVEF